MQGWEDTHGYGYMALGCSVTNNRAGAYVGPFHRWQNLHLTIIWVFPVVTTIPQRIIKYLPANLHISARLIRFIVIAIFGEGKNSGVIGKVAVSIRVIHMYLIEGSWWETWTFSIMAKVGSIPERGFESDLARGACSPRHSRTVTPYLHYRNIFGSDSRSGRYEVLV